MGWANCGKDGTGRPIGYAHEATCDEPGCNTKIDRGLAYACGGMHGEGDGCCEGYFCEPHRLWSNAEDDWVCARCAVGDLDDAPREPDGKPMLEDA